MSQAILPVTLFADFTCPFCFVTERALETVADSRPVELRPKAFELYPVPAPLPEQPQETSDLVAVEPLAREIGLLIEPPGFRPRTRKAHEAAAFAHAAGLGRGMRRGIYDAYWLDRRDIGRIDVLLEVAEAVGLDPVSLRIALDIDRGLDSVVADEALAERLGVVRVPTLFIGSGAGATILQGARPLAALDEALAGG